MPTTVTGTLIDSQGQHWTNAPVQFIFLPTPSTPGPFVWSGGAFNKMPPPIQTDSNGAFSTTLAANSEITPAGSMWQVIIGPSSTYPAFVFNISLPTGAVDISSLFSSTAIISGVQSLFIPRAYNNNEVIIPPNTGQLFYDVTLKEFKYWESGNWAVLGSSSGTMVYPPPGIAVSTGTGWAASIDPANLAFTNIDNHFTAPQSFGQVNVGSDLHVAGNSYLANGELVIGRVGLVPTGVPTIQTEGSNIVLDPVGTGSVLLSWNSGHGTFFGNAAAQQVGYIDLAGNASFSGILGAASAAFSGLLNTGSLQVGGAQPSGYILQSNGTSFVPVPFPSASHGVITATIIDYTGATSSRDWGIIVLNGPNLRIVTGTGHTAGSTPGSTQGLIGLGNPTTQVWGNTVTSTLVNGFAGFNFTVPPGYQYVVQKNTLSQGPGGGNGVLAIANWTEIDVSVV